MADLEAIVTRMERLEAENAALRARVSELEGRPSAPAPAVPLTRRELLTRAGTGAGALAIGALGVSALGPGSVRAGTGSVMLGAENTADSLTWIRRPSGTVLELTTEADTGVALIASSTKNSAVVGQSGDGAGVRGISFGGAAVKAEGVEGPGIQASSLNHRGGVFSGAKSQVRLLPSSRTTHPASGSRGDLFVDRSGRLWYCKGGTTWRQLA